MEWFRSLGWAFLLWSVTVSAQEAQPLRGLPEGVTWIPNLAYVPNGSAAQVLDLYRPAGWNATKRYPVIVLIHGGGWFGGSRKSDSHYMITGVMSAFLKADYVVASVDYTLSTESRSAFPQAVQDVRTATRFLRFLAAENPDYCWLDATRFGVWGGSAGGNLAEMLAATGNDTMFDTEAYKEYSSAVQSLVSYCGEADLTLFLKPDGTFLPGVPFYNAWYFGRSTPEETWKTALAASPLTYVDAQTPPMLLVHGNIDDTVPYAHSVRLQKVCQTFGIPCDLRTLDQTGHDGPEFVSTATLDAIVGHFHRTLKKRPSE